jgi:predicted enzyme related to lactoylglutathione lyase
MVEVASLVLFASDLTAASAFYRAVGVPLIDEDHDEGPVHAAAELGGVHFAIYQADDGVGQPAPGWRSASSDFPGFYVDSLDDVGKSLHDLGTTLLEDHQVRPWGCRIVAQDPDGRAVEINQRAHCP